MLDQREAVTRLFVVAKIINYYKKASSVFYNTPNGTSRAAHMPICYSQMIGGAHSGDFLRPPL